MKKQAKSLVFVDDEQSVLDSFRRNLRRYRERWDFHFFSSGADALAWIEQGHGVDLMVCDISMPGMDGYGVLERIRSDRRTAIVPFILLTGLSDRANVRKGMDLGADDYLVKPVSAEELVKAIEVRLDKNDRHRSMAEERLNDIRYAIATALPHEFRTPLTVIKTYHKILEMNHDGLDPDTLQDIFKALRDSSTRLEKLVDNYVMYSQLMALEGDDQGIGGLRSRRTTNLVELVRDACQGLAAAVGREGDLDLDVAPAELCLSSQYCLKIVQELVDNALKFSPPGSPVNLEGRADGEGYRLAVTDRGKGMDPADVQAIAAFSQFGRECNEQQGQGLGLTLVKMLVDLHGGRLSVVGRPQEGTRVEVLLPVLARSLVSGVAD